MKNDRITRILQRCLLYVSLLQGFNVLAVDATFNFTNQGETAITNIEVVVGSTVRFGFPGAAPGQTVSHIRTVTTLEGATIGARIKYSNVPAWETYLVTDQPQQVFNFHFNGDPPPVEYYQDPEVCNNTQFNRTYSFHRDGQTIAIVNVPGGGCKTVHLGPFPDTTAISAYWTDENGNVFQAFFTGGFYQAGSQPATAMTATDNVTGKNNLTGPLAEYPGLIDWDNFDNAVLDPLADAASEETLRKGFDQSYAAALEANQALINQLNEVKGQLSDLRGGNGTGFSNIGGKLTNTNDAIAQLETQLAANQATLAAMRVESASTQNSIASTSAATAAATAASNADLASIKGTLSTIQAQTTGIAQETTQQAVKSEIISGFDSIEAKNSEIKTSINTGFNAANATLNIIKINTAEVSDRIETLNGQQATRNNELKTKFNENVAAITALRNEANIQTDAIIDTVEANTLGVTTAVDGLQGTLTEIERISDLSWILLRGQGIDIHDTYGATVRILEEGILTNEKLDQIIEMDSGVESAITNLTAEAQNQSQLALDQYEEIKTTISTGTGEVVQAIEGIDLDTSPIIAELQSMQTQDQASNDVLQSIQDSIETETQTQTTELENTLGEIKTELQSLNTEADAQTQGDVERNTSLDQLNQALADLASERIQAREEAKQSSTVLTNQLEELLSPYRTEWNSDPEVMGSPGRDAALNHETTVLTKNKSDAIFAANYTTGGAINNGLLNIPIRAGSQNLTINANPLSLANVVDFLDFSHLVWTWVLTIGFLLLNWKVVSDAMVNLTQANAQSNSLPGPLKNPLTVWPLAIAVTLAIAAIPAVYYASSLFQVGSGSLDSNPFESATGIFSTSLALAKTGFPVDQAITFTLWHIAFRWQVMVIYQGVAGFIRAIGK